MWKARSPRCPRCNRRSEGRSGAQRSQALLQLLLRAQKAVPLQLEGAAPLAVAASSHWGGATSCSAAAES
jgi:hypothetical protein